MSPLNAKVWAYEVWMSKAEKKVKVQEEEFDDNMGRLKL